MIKHLLKIVWNRKRANIFIVAEIALSLVVVFIVAVFAIYYLKNYISPLGYDYENVISVDVYAGGYYSGEKEDKYKKIGLLKRALKDFSEVEAVACAGQAPHSYSSTVTSFTYKNTEFHALTNFADTDFAAVMKLKQIQGRWFLEEDKLLTETPIVINERFAKQIFGSETAAGKVIITEEKEIDGQSGVNQQKFRVIGVVSEYREGGDLAEPTNFMFILVKSSEQKVYNLMNLNLLARLKPGTTVDFEEQILKKLNQENPGYTYHLELLSEMRIQKIKRLIGPIISISLIGVFLVLMVAFGLIGTLWQSITQRTKEIGLRRANGATSVDIYKQVVGEIFVITGLGLLVGSVLIANLYLLNIDLLGMFSATKFEKEASSLNTLQLFFSSFFASCIFIYLLTFLCATYPSYLAAKVKPAEALHCD